MPNDKINKSINKLDTIAKKAKKNKNKQKEETYRLFHLFINNEDEPPEKLSDKIKECIAKLTSKFGN